MVASGSWEASRAFWLIRCKPQTALFLRSQEEGTLDTENGQHQDIVHALRHGGFELEDAVFLDVLDVGASAKGVEGVGVECTCAM